MAEAVLAKGDRLLATARNTQALNHLLDPFADRIATFPLNVADAAAATEAVNMAVSRFGRLDVLVNNAGYGTVSPIEDTSIEEFRAQIETNLLGTIFTTRAAIPIMREQRAGHII
jgi:NAD(P)-dependent dehydrogenase (short-subunit alcohol dehydrogenase family)